MSAHKRGVIFISIHYSAGRARRSLDRWLFFSSLFVVFSFSSRSSYLVYYHFTVNTTSTTGLGFFFLNNDLLIILFASLGNHNTILFSLLSLLCLTTSLPFLYLFLTLRRQERADGLIKGTSAWMKKMVGDLGLHTYLRNYTSPGLPAFLCVE